MKFYSSFLIFFLIFSCASHHETTNGQALTQLSITELNHSKETFLTKQNLLHLHQVYDLTPSLVSTKIFIDSQKASHPHPQLTLGIEYANWPEGVLADFLFLQMYWHVEAHQQVLVKHRNKFRPYLTKGVELKKLVAYELRNEFLEYYLGAKKTKEIITKMRERIYSPILTTHHKKIHHSLKQLKILPTSLMH